MWRALHIFLHDPIRQEAFLMEQVAPRVPAFKASAKGWFFIRYWEGGPHLRLRLNGMAGPEFAALAAELAAATAVYRSADPLQADAYQASVSPQLQRTALEESGAFHADGAVVERPYKPELDRYGGAAAMAMNEAVFGASSELALKVLAGAAGQPLARMGVSQSLMLAGARAAVADLAHLEGFLDEYAGFWRAFAGDRAPSDEAVEQAGGRASASVRASLGTTGTGGATPFGLWFRIMAQLAGNLRGLAEQGKLPVHPGTDSVDAVVRGILGSQIHMLSNRLSVGPAAEYAMARTLAAAVSGLRLAPAADAAL